ncbi:MAG: putative Ig domain-containing protein [Ilumatobacteraceae bacterium]
MKRILLVCALIASTFALQLGGGIASANTQVTPAAQSVSGVVGTAISATTAYTVTGISGTKVFVISPTLPAGLSINTSTGVVSGTPSAASVAANYTVTVSDGSTSATATITIAVSGTATLSPGTQTVTGRVGAAITATTAFTSTGLGTRYFSIAPALPAGLVFSSSTGVLSGTATAAKEATTYVVTAADGTNYAVATMRLTISAVPVMTPASQSVSGVVGTPIATTSVFVAPTLTDTSGTKTFTVSPALPAGLTLNAATGTVSGTPTAVSPQTTYVITGTDGTNSSANFATSTLTIVVAATAAVTTTTTVPTSTQGCLASTVAGRISNTVDVANSALPSTQFACSMRIAIRPTRAVVVAVAHQGTTINKTVASYSVVLKRLNGGSIVRPLTMGTTPSVLRANYTRLIAGTWSVTITAFSATGATVATYNSPSFRVG